MRKNLTRTLSVAMCLSLILTMCVGGLTAVAEDAVVQLDVFSASTASTTSAGVYDNTWWGELLRDKIGVSLNILPSGDQAQEKLQALMAGGQLPDIVIFRTTKDVQSAVRGNMLINLDDYLDQLPNVVANAPQALQYARDNLSNGEGKAYVVNNDVGPANLGDEPSWGPYLRWDLYKAVGSPEITSYHDYLDVLKAMQDFQPKTADGKNTYGLTLWKDWDGFSMFLATALGPTLGIDSGDQLGQLPFLEVNFVDGSIKSTLDADSQYIEALRFYYEANQMGLVDPDSLTQTYDTAKSKMTEGRVFFSWWYWLNDAYNSPERTNAEPPTGFMAVLPKETKTLISSENNIGKSWPFAISASTKNLDACLRYIDFMFSAEGNQLLFNGPEGVIWEMDADGAPRIMDDGWQYINNLSLELPNGGTLKDGMMVGSYGLSAGFVNPATGEPINYRLWPSTKQYQIDQQTNLQRDWMETSGYLTTIEYVKDNDMTIEMPLALSLVPSMTDEISASAYRIGDIVKVNSWKMIFAKDDAEFEALYQEMRTKADGLGLADVYAWSVENWNIAKAEAEKYE